MSHETHAFDGGKVVKIDWVVEQAQKNPLLDGITFSGGEPFEQAEAFAALAFKAKKLGLSIMTYTGYTLEQLNEDTGKKKEWTELLYNTDILVDGKFNQQKKNSLLKFKGSENQRIIDVRKSIFSRDIILAAI